MKRACPVNETMERLMASDKQKMNALEKAFLDVDQIAEDLVRLIGNDLRYKAKAVSALKQIMLIKKKLLKVVA